MSLTKEHYFEEINTRKTSEDYEYEYQEWIKAIQTFRDIPGYEGQYQVSNIGNVKSLKWDKERLLKPGITNNGYYYVVLFKDGKSKNYAIHQLVAMAFLNHKLDGTYNIVVDHINNDKLDNRVENLQLTTNRHNTSKDRKGTSKYIGVCFYKKYNKWVASIAINGKAIHLGYFNCEMHAGVTYQKALRNINLFDGDPKKFKNYLQNEK
jgi:hypothetical protein